jgi:hypothetical protein
MFYRLLKLSDWGFSDFIQSLFPLTSYFDERFEMELILLLERFKCLLGQIVIILFLGISIIFWRVNNPVRVPYFLRLLNRIFNISRRFISPDSEIIDLRSVPGLPLFRKLNWILRQCFSRLASTFIISNRMVSH